ncbi:MAG: hypothetical protein BWY83_02530 [bacterium ADurb.Bin478]|nr:MAG: hypothetical protein BWY83_02530 [bacterium ADurb.Bin478]
MTVHEGQQRAQVGELLPKIARHFIQQRPLAVHHLVVTEHKNEILMKGVKQGEGDHVVMVFAVQRILAEIGEEIVHPSHVPLHVESQAAEIGGLGNAGPGGGLFGDGEHAGIIVKDHLVELFNEIDGLQIFPAAEGVGNPLPLLAGIIQIEHAGHRVHPHAVHVIFFKPEDQIGDQKIAHFVAAVIENQRAPILVLALARVRVLVQMRAIEPGQTMAVAREMGGNPIDDHADVVGVQIIDEILKILRRAETGSGRIITGDLIPPGSVQRMLGNGQKLHVGVAHSEQILGELVRQLPIG